MENFDIERLKHDQDDLDQRRAKMSEVYASFRNAFFARLRKFAKEAVKTGLRNVKELKRLEEEKDFYEAVCTLNGLDMDIVASSHIIPLDVYSATLASQILIFTDENENAEPYIKVIFHEAPDQTYRYEVLLLADGVNVRLAIRGEGTADGGREAAEAILQHIYSLRRHWTDRPSLRAIREGKGAARTMGFVQQKP